MDSKIMRGNQRHYQTSDILSIPDTGISIVSLGNVESKGVLGIWWCARSGCL